MPDGIAPGRWNWPRSALGLTSLVCGVALLAGLGVVVARNTLSAQDKPDAKPEEPAAALENPFPNRQMAPEIDGGEGWLNSGELSLKDLRGKIVILDFWTYCCINCIHILPDLKHLEEKYGKQIVVIGVHSAKFDNEKSTENIRSAILRYRIAHPVINDSDMKVWRKFDVTSWPTFVVIDPEGKYLGQQGGEGNLELMDEVISRLIPYHRAKGTLDESPVKFPLEVEQASPTPLRFPGKILADEAGDRLFISDSNHNRIVVTTLTGKVKEIIGSGQAGQADGAYDKAEFDRLQGMALVGETLYVADTENHLLRAVDLKKKSVSTIAGTGKQAQFRTRGGAAKTSPLNSPWDLAHVEGKLYIAMAGPHQLWVYDIAEQTVKPFAGTGREDVHNGALLTESAFAQPSGIVTDGKFLFVADSEGSSIRKVSVDPDGEAKTIAGTSDLPQGRCLFAFGDKDGTGSAARFQHPLGLVQRGDLLYVADTYNHKIKSVDIKSGEVKTAFGDGTKGNQNNPARFAEPAGLAIAGDTMFVADTNNHLIRTINLTTNVVETLTIDGLSPPQKVKTTTKETVVPQVVPAQKVAAGDNVPFEVELELPKGFKLNKASLPHYSLSVKGEQKLLAAGQLGAQLEADKAEGSKIGFSVPLASKTGSAEITVTLTYYYCSGKEGSSGLCKVGTLAWTVPLTVAEGVEPQPVKLSQK